MVWDVVNPMGMSRIKAELDACAGAEGEVCTALVATGSISGRTGVKGVWMASMANRCMGLLGEHTSQGIQLGSLVQCTARISPSMQRVVEYQQHSSPWTMSSSSSMHCSRLVFSPWKEVTLSALVMKNT
jgi:hypothetical protein